MNYRVEQRSRWREIVDPTTELLVFRSRYYGRFERRTPSGRRFASIVVRAGNANVLFLDLIIATFATEAAAAADLAKKLRKSNELGFRGGEVVAATDASVPCPCCEGKGTIPQFHHVHRRMPPRRCPVCCIGRVTTTTIDDVAGVLAKWRRAWDLDQISVGDARRHPPLSWFGVRWNFEQGRALPGATESAAPIGAEDPRETRDGAIAPKVDGAALEQIRKIEDIAERAAAARRQAEGIRNGTKRTVPMQRRADEIRREELAKRAPQIARIAAKARRRAIMVGAPLEVYP